MARVLLVGKGAPERGGIPTFLGQLASAHWPDHDVAFLNLTHGAERRGGRFTLGNLGRTFTDARRLRAAVADRDVVHVHSALAPLSTLLRAGALCLMARGHGRLVIVHAHGGRLVDWASTAARRRVLRIMMGRCDLVVVVSADLETTMAKAGVESPIELVPNGVDTDVFRPADGPPSDGRRILFVGHLSPRKGALDLLEASRLLEDRGIPHRLTLVGGGADEGDHDLDRVRRARTESSELAGLIEPELMGDTYRRADVFCLPSWWEAAPLSILEAMASGLPVVATDVGDVVTMVGPAGLTVEPKRPAELADALACLLTDQPRREAMASAARQRAVDRYALATVLDRIEKLYRKGD